MAVEEQAVVVVVKVKGLNCTSMSYVWDSFLSTPEGESQKQAVSTLGEGCCGVPPKLLIVVEGFGFQFGIIQLLYYIFECD